MKTSRAQQAAELAAVLSEAAHYVQASAALRPAYYAVPNPATTAADALALLRIGASVSRWAVNACNGNGRGKSWDGRGFHAKWDETDDAAKEKADARALAKASEIAARYGATVEIGGDPRGYVLRLRLASGRKNGWGEGWGVA